MKGISFPVYMKDKPNAHIDLRRRERPLLSAYNNHGEGSAKNQTPTLASQLVHGHPHSDLLSVHDPPEWERNILCTHQCAKGFIQKTFQKGK